MTTSPGAQSLPCGRAGVSARSVPVGRALAVGRALPVCWGLAVCCALAVCWGLAVCPAVAVGGAGVGTAPDAVGWVALDVAAADVCRGGVGAGSCGEQLHTNTPITPITPASTRTRRRQ